MEEDRVQANNTRQFSYSKNKNQQQPQNQRNTNANQPSTNKKPILDQLDDDEIDLRNVKDPFASATTLLVFILFLLKSRPSLLHSMHFRKKRNGTDLRKQVEIQTPMATDQGPSVVNGSSVLQILPKMQWITKRKSISISFNFFFILRVCHSTWLVLTRFSRKKGRGRRRKGATSHF